MEKKRKNLERNQKKKKRQEQTRRRKKRLMARAVSYTCIHSLVLSQH